MPRVGSTKYPYTTKGKSQAKAAAKKRGMRVSTSGYRSGGACVAIVMKPVKAKKKPKKA